MDCKEIAPCHEKRNIQLLHTTTTTTTTTYYYYYFHPTLPTAPGPAGLHFTRQHPRERGFHSSPSPFRYSYISSTTLPSTTSKEPFSNFYSRLEFDIIMSTAVARAPSMSSHMLHDSSSPPQSNPTARSHSSPHHHHHQSASSSGHTSPATRTGDSVNKSSPPTNNNNRRSSSSSSNRGRSSPYVPPHRRHPTEAAATTKTPWLTRRFLSSSSRENGSGGSGAKVKKERPSSPSMQQHRTTTTTTTTRHRPRKLDLSASRPTSRGLSARPPGGPMTAREGGGGGAVNMQEVGVACLSPGFQTHDPVMREQLQRSLSVRDQQRSIIEARMNKTPKDVTSDSTVVFGPGSGKHSTTSSSKRRPPPAGLSIVPPSASKFADERVIQSAPLNNTFSGLQSTTTTTQSSQTQQALTARHAAADDSPHPLHRHHHHHHHNSTVVYPANQTNNRLPPLSDVFRSGALGDRDSGRNGYYQPPPTTAAPPLTAKPIPPPSPVNASLNSSAADRPPREYRSAEEAVHELSGGREDLLPRIVHYSGHQPVTPPSPRGGNVPPPPATATTTTGVFPPQQQFRSSRRRPRSEYEMDNGSPPMAEASRYHHRPAFHHGPFGAGRDSPEIQRRKKEEFLGLCSRAWDLFHS